MIPVAKPNLKGNEMEYVTKCVETEWISSSGRFVKEFEDKFKELCGCEYALSCSNGTTALHLALDAIGLKEGDKIILPNLTFASSINAVRYCGAKEILVDVDRKTFNIDPVEIEKHITSKTKAIMIVHLYGFSCDMDAIMEIVKKHNLYLIEDTAEAHLATYNNQVVGTFGDIGTFSFFGNKLVTTGEGGMCITNNSQYLETMRVLKNHGMKQAGVYIHDVVGYNYRLTNMQAAVGLAQLERIDDFISRRDEIAQLYKKELADIKEISFQEAYENSKQVYWMVSIVLSEDCKISVEDLAKALKDEGIDSRRMFYPLNQMKPYLDDGEFPNSQFLYDHSLVLPTYYDLSDDEVLQVCDVIKKVFN